MSCGPKDHHDIRDLAERVKELEGILEALVNHVEKSRVPQTSTDAWIDVNIKLKPLLEFAKKSLRKRKLDLDKLNKEYGPEIDL